MIPISDWCRHKALIFDDAGLPLDFVTIKRSSKTFSYRQREYNFMPDQCSYFKVRRILGKTKYYFYNLDNPMPLVLSAKKPPIDSKDYYSIMETKLIEKLDALSRNSLLNLLLNWKVLLIALVIIGLIWWYSRGGDVSTLASNVTALGSPRP